MVEDAEKVACVELLGIIRAAMVGREQGTALNALSWALADLLETVPDSVRLRVTNAALDAIRDRVTASLLFADRISDDA
jgi:hypothetical protein